MAWLRLAFGLEPSGQIRLHRQPSGASLSFVAQFPLPAEHIDAGPVVLRRIRDADADEVARAVGRSLEHLRPWMRWATPDAGQPEKQRERIALAQGLWDEGDCRYVVCAEGDVVVGGCGLHRRVGPGGIEIGYWVHVDYIGRGFATAAAKALTEAALALPDIVRVEIHCDYANVRSQAIPRRLGYRLERIDACDIVAPAEVGKRMIWVSGQLAEHRSTDSSSRQGP